MGLLYKICSAAEWARAEAAGVYIGSTSDQSDGFIHLSSPHQVRETARQHFAGAADLVLVALAEGNLPELKWEPSRGGDLFPHVYGVIPPRAATWVCLLPLKNGVHVFPDGIPW